MRIILARHAETVYNAGALMQGHMAHTPLTRIGIAQAEAMGAALAAHLDAEAELDIWASPAGRTLQTVAIIAEYLGRDFFDVRIDARLLEIDVGDWEGRRYADIVAETGPSSVRTAVSSTRGRPSANGIRPLPSGCVAGHRSFHRAATCW